MGADRPGEADFQPIVWIRKRDGSVVPFDSGKLASSILAAVEACQYMNPGFVTQELSGPVLHFLSEKVGSEIPSSQEVTESVVLVLRQLHHADVAEAYASVAAKRGRLRDELRIVTDLPPAPLAPEGRTIAGWSKAKLIERLESEADLDAAAAREVATSLERKLLATGLSEVTSALLEELIYCEFKDRGIRRPWARRPTLGIRREPVQWALGSVESPAEIVREAGFQVLREYALRDVYSRDVAALVDEGLIILLGKNSPCHWSAWSVPVLVRGAGNRSIERMLDQWEEWIERAVESTTTAIALEGLDAVMARLVGGSEAPGPMASRMANRLQQLARRHPVTWVVNLFGSVPAELSAELVRESLFDDRPIAEQNAWAREFTSALLTELDPRSSARIRLDMHLDALQPPDETEALIRRMLRGAHQELAVGFTFDRPSWSAGEGLFAEADRGLFSSPLSVDDVRPPGAAVLAYIGIDLPKLLDRMGGEDDGHLFVRRLDSLCDSAVRLALQQREHLRNRWSLVHPSSGSSGASPVEGALVVCPVGLSRLVERITGAHWLREEAGLAFAERILRRMGHRLARESKPYRLACRLDAVPGGEPTVDISAEGTPSRRWTTGVVSAAGRLHAAMGGGTAYFRQPSSPAAEDLVRLVLHALQESTLSRLILAPAPPDRQPKLFD